MIEAGIHQTEDGPLVLKDTTFIPGETLFFSCRLDGFRVSPGKRVSMQYEVTALDPDGVAIVEPAAAKIEVELSPEDKDWKPIIRHTVQVPALAGPGAYKIHVAAKDELGAEQASFDVSFEVRGRKVERSDALVVRNFNFYRGEDDAQPIAVASYRPGDSVWARFDITGYKLGPENLREVAYTVMVTGEGGKVFLAPGAPSIDEAKSFYPVRFTPCLFTVNLQRNIAPGEYTVTVHAEDRIGGQKAEGKQTFRVE